VAATTQNMVRMTQTTRGVSPGNHVRRGTLGICGRQGIRAGGKIEDVPRRWVVEMDRPSRRRTEMKSHPGRQGDEEGDDHEESC